MKYLWFCLFMFLYTNVYAVMPTSLLYKDFEATYQESSFFSDKEFPKNEGDCRHLAKLAHDVAILKAVDINNTGLVSSYAFNIPSSNHKQSLIYRKYVKNLETLLDNSVFIYWTNTSWIIAFIDLTKSYAYSKCVDHLDIKPQHGSN